MRSVLSASQRQAALDGIESRTYDVVVVGGGVTGAGTALDAVSRGLSVLLVEAADLASGTSSRSGKIFHGGLRYLEQLNFRLVREALVERDLMVQKLCPYLVEPVPFLIPFTHRWERPYIGAGVALYDVLRLTGPRSVRGHRHLTRRGALREMPDLRPDITGAAQYYDVRVDDARHTLQVARTAAGLGATVLTRTPVISVLRTDGAVSGVRIRDELSGRTYDVRARVVVNAAGVWADQVQALAGEQNIDVTPAKGIHLMVPGDRIRSRTGLVVRTPDSVFIIRRWFDYWLMGTTDTRWEFDRSSPMASRADVDYLLGHANRWLRRPLDRSDVVGIFAGLRPLVSGRGPSTAALRRDHAVIKGPPGMVTIVGGKYTTYRLMARDVVNAAAPWPVPPSPTRDLPLLGAPGYAALRNQRESLARDSGLSLGQVDHLLGRYGTETTAVLDLVADNPALGKPLVGDYLAAEVVYAVRNEGALRLDDVLLRRTRAALETGDRALSAAPRVAGLMGDLLGWDASRREEEVERYRLWAEAEDVASFASDDAAAVTAARP
jgi:glycerol-3-phosphate dehydrogenase